MSVKQIINVNNYFIISDVTSVRISPPLEVQHEGDHSIPQCGCSQSDISGNEYYYSHETASCVETAPHPHFPYDSSSNASWFYPPCPVVPGGVQEASPSSSFTENGHDVYRHHHHQGVTYQTEYPVVSYTS